MKKYAYALIAALTLGSLVSEAEAGCRGGRCGRKTVSRRTKVVAAACTKKNNCQCNQCKAKRGTSNTSCRTGKCGR